MNSTGMLNGQDRMVHRERNFFIDFFSNLKVLSVQPSPQGVSPDSQFLCGLGPVTPVAFQGIHARGVPGHP